MYIVYKKCRLPIYEVPALTCLYIGHPHIYCGQNSGNVSPSWLKTVGREVVVI